MHENDSHALKLDPQKRYTIPIRILYLGAHHVLFIALLGYGIGVKIAVSNFSNDLNLGIYVQLPCWSMTVVVICLNVIRLTHPNHKPSVLVWVLRLLIVVVMAVAPMFATMVDKQATLWCIEFACLFLLIMVDVEGKKNRRDAKSKARESRMAQKEKDK